MNAFVLSFTKEIPIERFHNTKVIVCLKESGQIIVGDAKINSNESTISVFSQSASWLINFDEIAYLRFPPSGLVHDYWGESRGDFVHVPENGEWSSYETNKVLGRIY